MTVNLKIPSIPLCLIAATIISPQILDARDKDTIGLNDLLARKPGADGSGVKVGQVEASEHPTLARYQPSPAKAFLASAKFLNFDGATVYPNGSAFTTTKESNHANTVANALYDRFDGAAPDVEEIHVFFAGDFYTQYIQFGNTELETKIVNQSYIFDSDSNAQQQAARNSNYDDYADRYGILFINGLNNGSTTDVPSPAAMYNGIAVGTEQLESSEGPTSDGRSKPELLAPGGAASFATPYVSGAAAILLEAALANEGGAGTSSPASDIRVLKALLVNGAIKDPVWSNSTTQPLDTKRGAGMLEINHSYAMLEGGKHVPISSTTESSGGVHTPSSSTSGNISSSIGWNFTTITSSSTGGGLFSNPTLNDRVDNYYFDHTTIKDLVATITWNRQRNEDDINNLDLYLFNAATGAVVESSVSTVDNVEHIYRKDLPAGRYVLQVVKRASNNVTHPEEYGFAFRFSDPAPDAPSVLQASAASATAIALNWIDNSNDETNFEIQRSNSSSRNFNTIANVPANTTSYTDNGRPSESTYYYRIKATNSAGDSFFSNVSSATTFNQLDGWRFENFGISTDSGIAANDQDPDHDGLNNLTEYAIGTDPTSADGANGGMSQPKASMLTVGNFTYLQITVTRDSIKDELDYIIEVSNDIITPTWTEATTILENTATTLRVRDNVAIGVDEARFIRLRVVEK